MTSNAAFWTVLWAVLTMWKCKTLPAHLPASKTWTSRSRTSSTTSRRRWDRLTGIISNPSSPRPLKTPLTQAYFVSWSAFWQYIKSTRKDYTGVATLKVNGTIINDTKEKTNQLNRHFESVFTHENTIQPDLLPDASPYPVAPEADGTRPRLTYHAPW